MLLVLKCLYVLRAAELSSSGRWVFSKCLVALREVLQLVAVAALSSVGFFAYPWQQSSIFVFAINDESKSMRKKKKKKSSWISSPCSRKYVPCGSRWEASRRRRRLLALL
jgi:hypothetical protein